MSKEEKTSRMTKIILSEPSYQFIKGFDFSDIVDGIQFNDDERSVTTGDYELMLIIIHEDMEKREIENEQEHYTEYRKKVLVLFDEIHDSMQKSRPKSWPKTIKFQHTDGTIEEVPFGGYIHPLLQIQLSLSARSHNEAAPFKRRKKNIHE